MTEQDLKMELLEQELRRLTIVAKATGGKTSEGDGTTAAELEAKEEHRAPERGR